MPNGASTTASSADRYDAAGRKAVAVSSRDPGAPHAADALRAMHSLNLLTHALPEFEAVNLLVLRDLYHRYTVDEHTLLAIDVLHQLKTSAEPALQPFSELLAESSARSCFTWPCCCTTQAKALRVPTTFTAASSLRRRLRRGWRSQRTTPGWCASSYPVIWRCRPRCAAEISMTPLP